VRSYHDKLQLTVHGVAQTPTPGQFVVWAIVERQLHRIQLTVRRVRLKCVTPQNRR
jgi:hypothetical protein